MKYTTYILIVLFCFGFLSAMSQSMRKADNEFENKKYMVAAEMYQDIFPEIENEDEITEVAYKIGECYRIINKYNKANTWFKKAIDRGYEKHDIQFKYAMTLMMAEEYKQAEKLLRTYLNTNPNQEFKKVAKLKIKSCTFAQKNTDSLRFSTRNLQEINTQANEFAPKTVKNKIIFTSSRYTEDSTRYRIMGDGFENLYETTINEGQDMFTTPELLKGEINSDLNNGTLAFDTKRNLGYFMQCNGLSGKDKNCNIYVSEYNEKDNTWEKPSIFQHNSKKYSSGHPALSPDGNTLYFVSNNPEGLGGTDIWMTRRTEDENGNEGKWTKPVNPGTPINTALNEMFPYMFDDSRLYFSSNGHIGYGGLDMYYTEIQDSVFSEPENLKKPFNSSADDFGITYLSTHSGLFSSNRIGGVGQDDLYYFKVRDVRINAKGTVINSETGKPIEDALVILTNNKGEADTVTTNEEGTYTFNLLTKNMEYYLVSVKDDYLTPQQRTFNTHEVTQDITISSASGYNLDFNLIQIEKGKEYTIKNIYYDLDKYSLRLESITELDKVADILTNNPDIYIQINSHTDTRANDEYNRILSQKRAKSVVDYLVSQGIDTSRLSWQGWGETKLAVPNAQTENEHQANRRTTFSIVNYDQLHLGEKAVFHQQAVERVQKQQAREEPTLKGVYFRIQIAAAHKPCNTHIFAKIKQSYPNIETYCTQYPDGFYKYTIGYFLFLEQAQITKTEINKLGYNSFIVAYKNGNRISINKALKEINFEQ
ncbi:MAG: OmpA family protein [Bacteroidales bacterium]